ncbi:MAG TPA: prepilin-type N-terminal cleavage/methylation domain-containing protein [bacterium]|nr:prepilin-type N-terminal cleavage/methylation domain-containing protein [bacterium]HPO08676.1 prepilin-type N-terminal cleavage/methylation domain-containing protein [bacterium]HQO33437.1 prepilin-type N-terminal cleavage/methylation domain-containing protein [bacterium]HQP97063.1 prepilin-type N-terminal cleavage/methylation domain-containing protein [bacterium]
MIPQQQRKSFTLIELLIVVAIIGILAAIAVPNFLNSQVRAKIARVKSDQKNIGTALDMYNVDHGAFPDFNTFPLFATRGVPELTTPVTYIADYPVDVFENTKESYGLPEGLKHTKMAYYNLKIIYYTGKAAGTTNFGRPEFEHGLQWGLRSIGPNRQYDNYNIYNTKDVSTDQYEPSNGLVSSGDIWTFGS